MTAIPRASWWPKHMREAFELLKKKIRPMDLVVEVRDARLPLTSSSAALQPLLDAKARRLVVLTKADLADERKQKAVTAELRRQGREVVHVSMKDSRSVSRMLSRSLAWMQQGKGEPDMLLMMVVGLPNTGKSSLINALRQNAIRQGGLSGRRAKAAATGPLPGVTKAMTSFQVSGEPAAYLLDTPGILQPQVDSWEAAAKLSLIGAVPADLVSDLELTAYLLRLFANSSEHRNNLHRVARTGFKHGRGVRALSPARVALALLETCRYHPPKQDDVQEQADIAKQPLMLQETRDQGSVGPASSAFGEGAWVAGQGGVEAWELLGDAGQWISPIDLERAIELAARLVRRPAAEALEHDFDLVHRRVVHLFQTGQLGRYVLDFPLKSQPP